MLEFIIPFIFSIILISFLFLISFQHKKSCHEFKYQYLLESPNDYYYGKEDIDGIDDNNSLIKTMKKFCTEQNIYQSGAIVSLSGGVDSMIVLATLLKIRTYDDCYFPIFAASIDYSQRDEQSKEINFLKEYCEKNDVKLYISKVEGYSRKKENSGSRTEFEEESRKIRFELYKKIMEENSCNGIFVGHHKDDIIENIFTNSMKGGNLLDLEVMKIISNIHGVNIYRPFLEFHKNIILDLSHSNNIPYFLDTTPKWSRRGRMRFEIFPLLDNVFSQSWRVKLKELGDQSNNWGNYINEYVLNPWFKKIIIGKYGFIMPFQNQPKLIYTNVLLKCMHKMGKHMLKSSSVDKIIENKKNFNKCINLDSGYVMFVDSSNSEHFILFNKDEIQKEINNYNIYRTYKFDSLKKYEHFINGNLNFKQPKEISKDYQINNNFYSQMKISLPKDILKVFTFRKSSEYNINDWIITGSLL
jgi:tRNA(Ile)-lysidine synthetase-like protein